MRRMLKLLSIRLLLVFALLFAQVGGLVHGIEHTLAEKSQDQSLPHDKHCELCAAYAQVGSAVGSSNVSFDFALPRAESYPAHSFSFRSTAFSAFTARAPPYSA